MATERLLVAEIHGLAGREPELSRLLGDLANAARQEDGCLLYRVLRGDEPGEFVLLSHWRDEAALNAHYASAPYQRSRAGVGELLARSSDVPVPHVAESVHALDPNPPEPGRFG